MEWQSLITGTLVILATLIVARRFFGLFSGKSGSGCGSCGTCPGKSTGATVTPLVQLGSPTRPANESHVELPTPTNQQQKNANRH